MADLLTPHFTLAEMTRTSIRGVDNTPSAAQVDNLRAVAEMLEVVRAHFSAPVMVHSGYRSAAVNMRIGGSATSQHMEGEAADFHVHGVDLTTVWRWIAKESGIKFGQLILEGAQPANPTWIHLSIPGDRPPHRCGEVLVWDKAAGYRRVDPRTL